jgi:hypothetical protein
MTTDLQSAGPAAAAERHADGRLRVLLCALLAFGVAGTVVELFLLGHIEDLKQQAPLWSMAVAGLAAAAAILVRGRATLRFFQATMCGLVIVGAVGVWLHYRGNVEFELEMYPSLRGIELFRKAMTGATPTLAPGLMVQLGLLGLACTYGIPGRRSEGGRRHEEET